MKIDHCCGGFESKIRKVGKILTKQSIEEWTFHVWSVVTLLV